MTIKYQFDEQGSKCSTITNNIPVISYLSNSLPFPISYSSSSSSSSSSSTSTSTSNNSNNNNNNSITSSNSPNQLNKDPSKDKKMMSTVTLGGGKNISGVGGNQVVGSSSTATFSTTSSTIFKIGTDEQFSDIIGRLQEHSHLLATLGSFIENINNDQSLSVQDICSSVKSFINTTLPMLCFTCGGIPFQSPSTTIQSDIPPISSLQNRSPQEVEIIIYEFLEQYLTSKLYRRLFSSSEGIEKDTHLCEHISKFQHIQPSNLDIGENIISTQFLEQIQEELLHMTAYKSPREKLMCINKSFKLLFKLLAKQQQQNAASSPSSSQPPQPIGADLLLPIIIFCLIKSNLPFLYSNLQFISLFRDPNLIEPETNYYLVTLITATSFIQDMTFESLTDARDPSKDIDEKEEVEVKNKKEEAAVPVSTTDETEKTGNTIDNINQQEKKDIEVVEKIEQKNIDNIETNTTELNNNIVNNNSEKNEISNVQSPHQQHEEKKDSSPTITTTSIIVDSQQQQQQQQPQLPILTDSKLSNEKIVKIENQPVNINITKETHINQDKQEDEKSIMQYKKEHWKYYNSKVEDLSVKDVRQLLSDFNQLVDLWYKSNK
eukprot:gene775-961_t